MLTFENLPVAGSCMAFRPPGHARHVLDVIGVDDQRLRAADAPWWRALVSLGVERFAGWGREVVAPMDARVISVHDGEPDRATVSLLRDIPRVVVIAPLRTGGDVAAMAGNHVVLEVAGGFVLLAHLRRGSIGVSVGDAMTAGEQIGRIGNSGNTLMPHLHVQPMSSADPSTAVALPWRVTAVERYDEGAWIPSPGPIPLRTPLRTTGSSTASTEGVA